MLNQSAHAMPVTPRVDASPIQERRQREDRVLNRQRIEDAIASVPSLPPARMAPPPLVSMPHDAVRSSVAPPPSLVPGGGIGRKMDPNQAAATEPAVEVTIGRIELTAVSTAPDTKRKPGARRPAMSLEEYLTRRQGGRS